MHVCVFINTKIIHSTLTYNLNTSLPIPL